LSIAGFENLIETVMLKNFRCLPAQQGLVVND
jgi:hypothetical protein